MNHREFSYHDYTAGYSHDGQDLSDERPAEDGDEEDEVEEGEE